MPITFRYWKDGSQIVEIKADKYFARANGYNSIDDMVASTIGDINGIFGGVPGWVRVDPNGHFYFIEISKSILVAIAVFIGKTRLIDNTILH